MLERTWSLSSKDWIVVTFPRGEVDQGTQRFLELLSLRKKNCIWSHSLIFLKSWKFNSFLESSKERKKSVWAWGNCPFILLHLSWCQHPQLPLGMKLKCQIFMIMTWLQSKDRKKSQCRKAPAHLPTQRRQPQCFLVWFLVLFLLPVYLLILTALILYLLVIGQPRLDGTWVLSGRRSWECISIIQEAVYPGWTNKQKN